MSKEEEEAIKKAKVSLQNLVIDSQRNQVHVPVQKHTQPIPLILKTNDDPLTFYAEIESPYFTVIFERISFAHEWKFKRIQK